MFCDTHTLTHTYTRTHARSMHIWTHMPPKELGELCLTVLQISEIFHESLPGFYVLWSFVLHISACFVSLLCGSRLLLPPEPCSQSIRVLGTVPPPDARVLYQMGHHQVCSRMIPQAAGDPHGDPHTYTANSTHWASNPGFSVWDKALHPRRWSCTHLVTVHPPVSISWVAGMTGLSHHTWLGLLKITV